MPKTSSTLRLTCADAEATRRVGSAIGRWAEPGATVLLQGDLGAGKTVVAQGVGRGLELPTVVNSPTFVLVNEHLGGRLPMRHADLYRLDDLDLIAELGLDQAAEGGILLVEWPERAQVALSGDGQVALSGDGQGALPADHLLVRISPLAEEISEDQLDASPRELILTAHGRNAQALLTNLASSLSAVPA